MNLPVTLKGLGEILSSRITTPSWSLTEPIGESNTSNIASPNFSVAKYVIAPWSAFCFSCSLLNKSSTFSPPNTAKYTCLLNAPTSLVVPCGIP
jgi:hypothetical protein